MLVEAPLAAITEAADSPIDTFPSPARPNVLLEAHYGYITVPKDREKDVPRDTVPGWAFSFSNVSRRAMTSENNLRDDDNNAGDKLADLVARGAGSARARAEER